MSSPDDQQRVADLLRAPSYTPARRDLAIVASLIGAGDERAVRGLLRAAPEDAIDAVERALAQAPEDGAAAKLVSALGQVARAAPATDAPARLIARLDVTRPGRAVVVALGKLGGDAARAALLVHAARADLPADHVRALIEALGKVGGAEAEARLAALAGDGSDAEATRRRDRAILMAERDRGRDAPSGVRGDAAMPEDVTIVCRCRRGLEDLLAEELRGAGFAADVKPAAVRVRTRAPLARLFAARIWLTIGIERPIAGDDVSGAIAAAAPLLAALTDGAIRWRLDFTGAGPRRARVWKTAQEVRDAAPSLVNDPTATTWEVVVAEDGATLELRPRRLDDPRFAWRVADVAASSHPTVAAALARVAGARRDDVVWDPFCGSGAELCERAALGGFARLIGSDLDARALEAARANLAAAGATAELVLADALAFDPGPVSLILTNPPLGRRLRGDPGPLLERFVQRAARLLRPGGRLVWVTPAADRTGRAARRAGLRLDSRRAVDLGGFDAELERWSIM